MLAGFPRLGDGVAVAWMALTALLAVVPTGYVGKPDAVSDTVTKSALTADETLGPRPPTGAQRAVLRVVSSGVVYQ